MEEMKRCPACKNKLIELIGNDGTPAKMTTRSDPNDPSSKTYYFYECLRCGLVSLFNIDIKRNLK